MRIESSTPDSLSKKREFRQRLGLLSVASYAIIYANIDAHYPAKIYIQAKPP